MSITRNIKIAATNSDTFAFAEALLDAMEPAFVNLFNMVDAGTLSHLILVLESKHFYRDVGYIIPEGAKDIVIKGEHDGSVSISTVFERGGYRISINQRLQSEKINIKFSTEKVVNVDKLFKAIEDQHNNKK